MSAAAEPAAPRRNNFDVLRLLAAVAVVVSHSFGLTGRTEPAIGGTTLGTMAVLTFFAISGFLITDSWLREPHLLRFLVKRTLRIFPALFAMALVTAFVVGASLTTLPIGDYLRSPLTWRYFTDNAFLLHFNQSLPGVFAHINGGYVNGSVWTLPHEARAYLIVGALGVLGLLRDRGRALLAFGLLLVVANDATRQSAPWLGNNVLLEAFVVGGALLLARDRVPWRWSIAIAGLAAWVALSHTPYGVLVSPLAIPYAAITAAHRTPGSLRRIVCRGDFSYGLYLWGWVVQQTVASKWPGITPAGMIAASLPVAYALGASSWFLVERPALRLKSRPMSIGLGVPAPAAAD